jgi:hypothetical protein
MIPAASLAESEAASSGFAVAVPVELAAMASLVYTLLLSVS